jgi:hypothetical protein
MFDRLHGAIRYLRSAPAGATNASTSNGSISNGSISTGSQGPPWWDPDADASVSPETDHVVIAGVRVARGSRVTMLPGARRADAQDLFLAGRDATVQAVVYDVDGNVHVAVSPDGDEAADLQRAHGRYLYFSVDELQPHSPRQQEPDLEEDPA